MTFSNAASWLPLPEDPPSYWQVQGLESGQPNACQTEKRFSSLERHAGAHNARDHAVLCNTILYVQLWLEDNKRAAFPCRP